MRSCAVLSPDEAERCAAFQSDQGSAYQRTESVVGSLSRLSKTSTNAGSAASESASLFCRRSISLSAASRLSQTTRYSRCTNAYLGAIEVSAAFLNAPSTTD